MGVRKQAALAVCAGLLAAGAAAGSANADSNDNLADPPMVCGSAPLSLTGESRPCVTEQLVRQRIVKHDTTSADIVDFADVITPLDIPLG
ncbi:hypothetical protein [Streptomyces sp. PR69]|uniref:hypothetical protein n=1 Tax=Streptomyces sp. PR69 TaxID=2984950 RepID=UPI0022654EC1|nr:hypothetical protein [Streptomyces sp. PR69]